ncbi:MAG: YifB family Mg chelatase-like AAA ATPase [Lachnospiraceae bacterium]|nr:YifB family Mg chelatase-like AAA ATPase [Lachnospiraceae bacterium]MBR5766786.1 YifB family Mg chelatase-like AAA ATPase [Lachnospiraceae bacterium]
MFSSVLSFGIRGIEGFCVNVEADISDGMPMFELVGYLSGEVKEARERVRTALKNTGYDFPVKRITLNLSPGNVRKQGTGYDLPMAVAILAAMGEIDREKLNETMIIGELKLNGDVGRINGVLPMVICGRKTGIKRCIVPAANAAEGAMVNGVEIIPVSNLKEAADHLKGTVPIRPYTRDGNAVEASDNNAGCDLKYVRGQAAARRGLEIAACGMHNMLMVGAPGAGKSMLAKCIPTILPPLSDEEALEVSSIYSVAGLLKDDRNLMKERPFVSPHHTVTDIAMTGGGTYPRPGSISLSHRGVLFLDEMPEFSRYTLEVLRQPLEDRKITIARNFGTYVYPADFMLVGAMNPCPCGAYPDLSKCTCTEPSRRRYLNRLSRPLLDRMDICVDVMKLGYDDMLSTEMSESSAQVRKRVIRTQEIQRDRFSGGKILFNSQMNSDEIHKYCALEPKVKEWFAGALEKLDVSARGYSKILKVARTIADIDGLKAIRREHLAEAMQLNNSYIMG